MEIPVAVVLLSFAITVILGRSMLILAPQLGLMDDPGERKPHSVGTPLGGIALVFGCILPLLIFGSWGTPLFGWLLGALAVAVLGLWDDRSHLSPGVRLVGQVLAAFIPVLLGGFLIQSLNLFGWVLTLGVFSIPFTLLWIVSITNAMNLIDGLDGLATGAVLVVGTATAIFSTEIGSSLSLLLSAALFGSGVGFLIYNLHPARLFLGDGGSYFLGFTLAMLTVNSLKSEGLPLHGVPLLIPVVLLLYPIADTLCAIIRRIWAGRSVFKADQEHIHHLLLSQTVSYAKAIFWLYGIFILLGLLSLALFFYS